MLAQGNVFSTNFGNKIAFLANICKCKLRIFSPLLSHGVHIFSSDKSRIPLWDCLEHQKLLMISELIFCNTESRGGRCYNHNESKFSTILDIIVSLVDVDNVLLYVLSHHNIGKVDLLDVVVSLLQTKDLGGMPHQSPLDECHSLLEKTPSITSPE